MKYIKALLAVIVVYGLAFALLPFMQEDAAFAWFCGVIFGSSIVIFPPRAWLD